VSVLARAAARWPAVRCDADAIERELAARSLAEDAPHALDVALACALAAGDRGALEVFERELVPDIRGALVRQARSPDLVDDALQQMREKLLVGRRVLEYRGRGALAAWVQIVAIRELLMLQRKTQREAPSDDEPLLVVVVESDPTLALTKQTYRDAFADAFRGALAELTPRDRALLRLCFVEGAGTEHLARLYQVHRVTMFRWLTDARGALLDAIRKGLIARAGIAPDEVDSVLRAAASSLDIGW
jgi:RNA polymerase sigma-70 factor (ECF subfamily)